MVDGGVGLNAVQGMHRRERPGRCHQQRDRAASGQHRQRRLVACPRVVEHPSGTQPHPVRRHDPSRHLLAGPHGPQVVLSPPADGAHVVEGVGDHRVVEQPVGPVEGLDPAADDVAVEQEGG